MINVGVIGMGMMGSTHLDVYSKRDDVRIAAVSDINEDLLHGRAQASGNIEGQASGGIDLTDVTKYDEGMKLIKDKSLDLIDICLWTPLHLDYARAALRKGRHVLLEKPVARTYRDAKKLVAAAAKAKGLSMCGMCMRFWPGWDWLKDKIASGEFGKVTAAHFRRWGGYPGGPFYSNAEAAGGAMLDMHIHDIDFIYHCFGLPQAVTSKGFAKYSGDPDHVITRYDYDDGPLVVAEGVWVNDQDWPFRMRYDVTFERATAVFDLGAESQLTVFTETAPPQPIPLDDAMGYEREIDYFVNCIKSGTPPTVVNFAQAAESLKMYEAEYKSVQTGRPVKVRPS